MALDPTVAASGITDVYLQIAGLKADGTPDPDAVPSGDFPTGFAGAYDTYAKDGVVAGATNSGGDTSILSGFLSGAGQPVAASDFALAFAEYWGTVAVSPGAPAHGGVSVVSVTNDAIAHVSDFEAAIAASTTNQLSMPFYLAFIQNLESMAVSLIQWTIVEMMPSGSPSSFTETIS